MIGVGELSEFGSVFKMMQSEEVTVLIKRTFLGDYSQHPACTYLYYKLSWLLLLYAYMCQSDKLKVSGFICVVSTITQADV